MIVIKFQITSSIDEGHFFQLTYDEALDDELFVMKALI